jgi:hypothetical protein
VVPECLDVFAGCVKVLFVLAFSLPDRFQGIFLGRAEQLATLDKCGFKFAFFRGQASVVQAAGYFFQLFRIHLFRIAHDLYSPSFSDLLSFLSGVYRADIHLYVAEEGDGSKRSQKSYFSPE